MRSDTSPAAAAVQIDLYRRMSYEQKARRVSDLTAGACQLSGWAERLGVTDLLDRALKL